MHNISTISLRAVHYPRLLREIAHPPQHLFVQGALPAHTTPWIAIVGTRKASAHSIEFAEHIAEELVQKGIVVVSGLAFGIDAAAHRGALKGGGKTIAVLGSGVDVIYPERHRTLAEQIIKHDGAVISEYPPGTPALPFQFLARNRIVSGITEGTLVIEAPVKSGALITAEFALQENRNVFVAPGPAGAPHFEGSHALIRSGAELITRAEHILDALGISMEYHAPRSAIEEKILDILHTEQKPLYIDKIAELTNLKTQAAAEALAVLALEGIVEEQFGTYRITTI